MIILFIEGYVKCVSSSLYRLTSPTVLNFPKTVLTPKTTPTYVTIQFKSKIDRMIIII